jgi:hypothetical protein
MTTVYRGTRRTIKAGRHGSHSYTDLPVALIYSAVPPGAWGKPPAHFLKTSTVHAIELDCRTALDMVNDETWLSFSDVLTYLDYGKPGGITRKEAGRILNYLHNRLTGKAPGGEFQYKVYDPGGEEYEGDIMDMLRGVTAVAAFKRDFWDYTEGDDEEDVLSVATLLRADTFIYVDAPTFQKVAQRIGHDCVIYTDVFQGGQYVAKDLLNLDDIEDIPEVGNAWDLDDDRVHTIATFRPLSPRPIRVLWAKRSLKILGR